MENPAIQPNIAAMTKANMTHPSTYTQEKQSLLLFKLRTAYLRLWKVLCTLTVVECSKRGANLVSRLVPSSPRKNVALKSGVFALFIHTRHIKPVIGVQNKTSPKPVKGYLGIDAKARKTTLNTCVAAPSDLGLSIFQEVPTAILTRIARLPSMSHITLTRLHHHRGRQVCAIYI